jgi:NADH:ubiquinone oxidoreductase subunit 6 (subunit J)
MSLTSFLQSNKRIFTLSFFLLLFTTLTFLVIGLYHTTIFAAAFGLPYLSDYGVPITATSLGVGVSQFFNPVFCLIALIGVFLFAVIFFIIIGAEFLALVFLIVYVGAIAILFLFVIMLLNVKELATAARRILVATQRAAQSAGVPLSCSFVAFLSFFFGNLFGIESLLNLDYIGAVIAQVTSYVGRVFQDVMIFAELLYTYYSGLFMEIALLLLTAMVGSIVLASGTVDIESKKAVALNFFMFMIVPATRVATVNPAPSRTIILTSAQTVANVSPNVGFNLTAAQITAYAAVSDNIHRIVNPSTAEITPAAAAQIFAGISARIARASSERRLDSNSASDLLFNRVLMDLEANADVNAMAIALSQAGRLRNS